MNNTVHRLAVVMLLLLASACARSSSPATVADPQEQARRYARCMAEHGAPVDEARGAGPHAEGSTLGPPSTSQPDLETFRAAAEACRTLEPGGGRPVDEREKARMLEQERAFAKCMRENGVSDFPDPDPHGLGDGPAGQITGSSDPGKPFDQKAWDRADEKCRQVTTPAPERTGGK